MLYRLAALFQVVQRDHIRVFRVVVRQRVGPIDAPDGAGVFARNAARLVAYIARTRVNEHLQFAHDFGMSRVHVLRLADVGVQIVEFAQRRIVFAHVQLPASSAHGLDAVALVVEKGLVPRRRALHGRLQRRGTSGGRELGVRAAELGQEQPGRQVHRQGLAVRDAAPRVLRRVRRLRRDAVRQAAHAALRLAHDDRQRLGVLERVGRHVDHQPVHRRPDGAWARVGARLLTARVAARIVAATVLIMGDLPEIWGRAAPGCDAMGGRWGQRCLSGNFRPLQAISGLSSGRLQNDK